MFSACLLLAAPLGRPSATLVLRVPPDCQGANKPQPFVRNPLSLPKFLTAGKGREEDGVKHNGNTDRVEKTVAGATTTHQEIRRPQLNLKELGTTTQLTQCQLCTGRS